MIKRSLNFEALVKGFENNHVFSYAHPYELYRKWLEAMWAFMDAVLDREAFTTCLKQYTAEQGAEFGRLLGLYVACVEQDPFEDILGQTFMRLDVKSAAAGQFFTPMSVAEMMARVQFNKQDFMRLVEEKGSVSVCDPAVGSGVMLLSFAKIVHQELGRWGTGKLRLYGQDIDQRCVNMTRIQLRMNGLDAFGRMAGLLGALEQMAENMPAGSMVLQLGRQLELPGVAA